MSKEYSKIIEEVLDEGSVGDTKIEFLKSIKSHLENNNLTELMACHGPCPDGIVSGALLKCIFPNYTLVPLDYWFINHPKLSKIAEGIQWRAVIDLVPLNQTFEKELYIDHHQSALKYKINSKQVLFYTEGESAAAVCFDCYPKKSIFPAHMESLVTLSRITDTGNEPGSPPIDTPKKTIECSNDELVWLFEDACNACSSVTQVLELVDGFVKFGKQFLNQDRVQESVKKSREERKRAIDLGLTVKLGYDFVVTISKDGQLDNTSLLKSAISRCRVGGASFVEERNGSIRISLRLSKIFQNSNGFDINTYRLDTLANRLNGGGHMAAAGARSENIEVGLNEFKTWATSLNLNLLVCDFRT